MKMLRLTLSLLVLTMLASSPAFAKVDTKSGNFYISFTEIEYKAGLAPKVERTYNSKTSYKGIFGWGWGCQCEDHLETGADGSVVIHEFGGGADNVFSPQQPDPARQRTAVDKLAAIKFPSGGAEANAYREKLTSEESFRNQEWRQAVSKGLLEPVRLPVGTHLVSRRFFHEEIIKTRDGYVRYYEDGSKEEFDDAGKLRRFSDSNDNYIVYSYDDYGRLSRMVDNLGQFIGFSYNSRGLVTGLAGERGKAELRYDDRDCLVYSKDTDGVVNEYEYDKRYNMTRIRYDDGTDREMRYYPPPEGESIRSVKDRDGSVTTYRYDIESRQHFTVTVSVANGDTTISENSYEYRIERLPSGREITRQLISTEEGRVTDTSYNDIGLPTTIIQDSEKTRFEYDSRDHVTLKETPAERRELEYDPLVNKIVRVKYTDKISKTVTVDTRFWYDNRGNLLRGRDKDGTEVSLSYDSQGRIASLSSGSDQISFTYNNRAKPVVIAQKGVGILNITYDANGEIVKVDSTQGQTVALSVTKQFQLLLDIIRPAGVTFGF